MLILSYFIFKALDDDALAYPVLRRSRSRITDTWTKTLRRKIGIRRSVRLKKQTNGNTTKTNYAVPFGNSFDYFRFVDTINGLDKVSAIRSCRHNIGGDVMYRSSPIISAHGYTIAQMPG